MKNAVSLLPPEYLKQRAQTRNLQHARSIMLAVVALLIAGLIAVAAFLITIAASLSSLKEQNLQVQKQIQVLSTFESLASETAALEAKVEMLRFRDPTWLAQMAMLGNALPRGVVLQTFSGSSVSRGPVGELLSSECVLTCVGSTFEDISITINALEEVGASDVVCTASNTLDNGGIVFSLSVTLLQSYSDEKGITP